MARSRGVYLPPAVWTAWEKCATTTRSFPARGKNAGKVTSVDALLRRIGENPLLLDRITQFLNSPVAQAESGLPSIIIRPEKFISRTIARIGITQSEVMVDFPEIRNDFKEIVMGLGYRWNESAWAKPVKNWTGAANRAAELGHQLLLSGFWIAPPTVEVQDLIVNESYQAEQKRIISVQQGGPYDGWFRIWWARSEDCYKAASRITASRYYKPVVVAPPEHYDEVQDFAGRHHFHLTPAACELITRARATIEAALLLVVKEPERIEEPDGIPVLVIPEVIGIADELTDDSL